MIGALTQGVRNSDGSDDEMPDLVSDDSSSDENGIADDDMSWDEMEAYMLLASSTDNVSATEWTSSESDDDVWNSELNMYESDIQWEATQMLPSDSDEDKLWDEELAETYDYDSDEPEPEAEPEAGTDIEIENLPADLHFLSRKSTDVIDDKMGFAIVDGVYHKLNKTPEAVDSTLFDENGISMDVTYSSELHSEVVAHLLKMHCDGKLPPAQHLDSAYRGDEDDYREDTSISEKVIENELINSGQSEKFAEKCPIFENTDQMSEVFEEIRQSEQRCADKMSAKPLAQTGTMRRLTQVIEENMLQSDRICSARMLSADSVSNSTQDTEIYGRYRAYSDPKSGIGHAAVKFDRFANPDVPNAPKNCTVNAAAARIRKRLSEMHLSKDQIIAMLHQGGPLWRLITALVDSGCSHTLVFDSLNDIVGEMASALKFTQAFGGDITTADRHGTIFCEADMRPGSSATSFMIDVDTLSSEQLNQQLISLNQLWLDWDFVIPKQADQDQFAGWSREVDGARHEIPIYRSEVHNGWEVNFVASNSRERAHAVGNVMQAMRTAIEEAEKMHGDGATIDVMAIKGFDSDMFYAITSGDITCAKYGYGARHVISRIEMHQGIEVDCARLPADMPFGDRSIDRDDYGDWCNDNPATSHGYHSRTEWEKSCRAADCTNAAALVNQWERHTTWKSSGTWLRLFVERVTESMSSDVIIIVEHLFIVLVSVVHCRD